MLVDLVEGKCVDVEKKARMSRQHKDPRGLLKTSKLIEISAVTAITTFPHPFITTHVLIIQMNTLYSTYEQHMNND